MDGSRKRKRKTVNKHQLSVMELNDDCLLKIMDNLNALDLCAIKDTCRRFRNLSTYYFQLTYKKSFSFGRNLSEETIGEWDAAIILLHFGQYITKLILNSQDLDDDVDILHIIGKYENIKELELNHICINTIYMAKAARANELFSNLERLSINLCFADDDSLYQLLWYSKRLKHLEIDDTELEGSFLKSKFGQLESLSLIDIKCFERSYIDECFKEHVNLKKVEMIKCNFTNDTIFCDISDNLVNIEEISIQLRKFTKSFQTNVSTLLKLHALKRLEFNCGGKPIAEFIRSLANNSLEHLSISDTELNKDLCDALIKLQNLKTLKLISMQKPSKKFPKFLHQNFKQLEQLFIVDFSAVNAETVFEIVSNAGNLKKLFVKECSQFTGFDRKQFAHLLECRRKCYKGSDRSDLIVYMEKAALKTTKEIISKEILDNGATYIILRSTTDAGIQNEQIISDKGASDGFDSYEFESSSDDEDDYGTSEDDY